jgi:hypothetical protein
LDRKSILGTFLASTTSTASTPTGTSRSGNGQKREWTVGCAQPGQQQQRHKERLDSGPPWQLALEALPQSQQPGFQAEARGRTLGTACSPAASGSIWRK